MLENALDLQNQWNAKCLVKLLLSSILFILSQFSESWLFQSVSWNDTKFLTTIVILGITMNYQKLLLCGG